MEAKNNKQTFVWFSEIVNTLIQSFTAADPLLKISLKLADFKNDLTRIFQTSIFRLVAV